MYRSSSLLSPCVSVDDIEDDAQLRRGAPGASLRSFPAIHDGSNLPWILAAHKIYGIPQTINTANYAYFLAYQELFSLRSRDAEASSSPRLVSEKDMDRMVTGTDNAQQPGLLEHSINLMSHFQMNSYASIVVKGLSSFGETLCNAQRKRNILPWLIIVECTFHLKGRILTSYPRDRGAVSNCH